MNPTDPHSGLTQAEKLGGVGSGDRDVVEGAVGGDGVGENSPGNRSAEGQSAVEPEARVIGRPQQKGLCGCDSGEGQRGREETECVG